jgi:hypothetical protein
MLATRRSVDDAPERYVRGALRAIRSLIMEGCPGCGHDQQTVVADGPISRLRYRLVRPTRPARCGACENHADGALWDKVFCQCRHPFHKIEPRVAGV